MLRANYEIYGKAENVYEKAFIKIKNKNIVVYSRNGKLSKCLLKYENLIA